MGGFLRQFSTALLNQASEGMEAQRAAEAKVAEEIKVREGKLYDKYLDSFFEMRKTMFEKPEQWYTTYNGVKMNWQTAYPAFMQEDLLKVDNLSNLKNTVDLLASFKPENVDDKTSKSWDKLLDGLSTRSDESAAYTRKIADLRGEVKEQYWKNFQKTDEWLGLFKKENADEAYRIFTTFKKVGEPKDEKGDDTYTNVLFESLQLEKPFSYKTSKTNNYDNSVFNNSQFDKLFSIGGQRNDFIKLWNNSNDSQKKIIATDMLEQTEGLFNQSWQMWRAKQTNAADMDVLNEIKDGFPSVEAMFPQLINTVKSIPDLAWVANALEEKDNNNRLEIVKLIKENLGDDSSNIDSNSIANDDLEVNEQTNTSSVVAFDYLTPDNKAKYEPMFNALAVKLGYNNFNMLYKNNPQVSIKEARFVSQLIDLKKADGTSMFLSDLTSTEPWVKTIFDDGQGISSLSKVNQSILSYYLKSAEANLTQSEIIRSLGMLIDWDKNHVPSGGGSMTRNKQNQVKTIAVETAKSILFSAGYVDDDSDAVKSVLTAISNNPIDGLKLAQARLNAVRGEGTALTGLLEDYAVTVREREKTGFAGWLRETTNSLFGSKGSQWNQLAGQGFFASNEFLADIQDKGEIIGADGNQVYDGTIDFIKKYIDQYGDDSSAKGIADGQAAALRIYIAYKMAKYFDPTGRVSDRDLQNQLDAFIGTDTSSFENVIGMLAVANDRVNKRLAMQNELISTGSFLKPNGQINAQYVNRMKGVENYKYLMHDSGMKLAERFEKYTPNLNTDFLLNTGKTTANGDPIFQLMQKKNPDVPRMGGPPMFGLFYSKNKDTGEYSFVPWHLIGAGEQSASPESSATSTDSTLEQVPDMEGLWRKKIPVPNTDQFRWEYYDNPKGEGDALSNPFI